MNSKKGNNQMKKIFKKIWRAMWDDTYLYKMSIKMIVLCLVIMILLSIVFGLFFHRFFSVIIFNMGYPAGIITWTRSMNHQLVPYCYEMNENLNCINESSEFYELCGNKYDNKFYVDFDIYWEECGAWYEKYGITKKQFEKYEFRDGLNGGTLIVLYGSKPENVNVGDIIVFMAGTKTNQKIMHRVVAKYEKNSKIYYTTKGDHAREPIGGKSVYNEYEIPHDKEIFAGKLIFAIPCVPENSLKKASNILDRCLGFLID